MTTQSWQASEALKSACDKSHNWITSRANKIKTLKSGYNQIRPRILPKGLSTFKKEHCSGFDDNDESDNFLKQRSRIHSVDIVDSDLRKKFNERFINNSECIYSIGTMNLNGLDFMIAKNFRYNFEIIK